MKLSRKILSVLGLVVLLGGLSASLSLADAPGNIQRLGGSSVVVTAPLDTNEDILAIVNVPPLGPNSRLEISGTFTHTNSVNNKTLRVRYSGISGTQYLTTVKTTTATTNFIVGIGNRGATNSQVSLGDNTGAVYTAGTAAVVTSSVDTTASTTIVITCQKATGAEACQLENWNAVLYP